MIATGYRVLIKGAAFYEDRYARGEDGRWRISHTGYVRTYEVMMSLDDAAEPEVHREPLGRARERSKERRREPDAPVVDAFLELVLPGSDRPAWLRRQDEAREVAVLTQSFADAVAEAEKIITGAPHIKTEADLAEGYDYLAGNIRASLQLAWAYQRDFPYFVSSTGPYTKMGLDNPDALYFHSYLRDDAEYVVTGRRGSTTDLSFQVLDGDYSPVEVPGSLTAFDDRAIEIAGDGTFELRFGPPGDRGRNYFTLGPGSAMLLVREVYSDWDAERRGTIGIRRADRAGRAPPVPDTERDGQALPGGRARSCCPGCGRSSPSPSGST